MKPPDSHGRAWMGGCLVMAAFVSLAGTTRADVVVLANGDRIECQVVGETAREISIRRRFKNTNILYVQNIPRSSVARIDKGEAESQPAPAAITPAQTPATMPAGAIENKPLYLRRAIEKWQSGQPIAAGFDLTHLLISAKRDELDKLSPECEKSTGMKLADFAARVHWSIAKSRSKSGPLRLTGVAPYEVPAVVPLLVKEYDEAMRREVQVREREDRKGRRGHGNPATRPAAGQNAGQANAIPAYVVLGSQPASDPAIELANRLTILNWIDRPNELNLTRAEAAAFGEAILYAVSLLNERLRLDPVARRGSLQSTLSGQRIQLLALLRGLGDRSAESERAKHRVQEGEHELKLQDLQKELDKEQNNLLQKALQLAQEQQLEQNAVKKPPQAAPKAAPPDQPNPGTSQ